MGRSERNRYGGGCSQAKVQCPSELATEVALELDYKVTPVHEHGLRMKALGRQGLLLISFLVSGLAGLALHQVAFQVFLAFGILHLMLKSWQSGRDL